MQLLISDANILIDMEVGELLDLMFTLPYQFKVPDMILDEELEGMADRLRALNIKVGELDGDGVDHAVELGRLYAKLSRYDCVGLALAKKEACPLLTGDGDLRAAASHEAVLVKGTVWLLEQLILLGRISVENARNSVTKMRENGRRLPWEILELMLRRAEA
ncbi:DUF3368 domain-containing protein [Aquitalea sp. USM4]|uniref:DUF3368 domain-containing protein n=1 Tax=Aquitalea sp. USM4 TaxID=1590041 RepID=UPI00103BF03E|nr:DUF3368 domain-containing protein [Aquitalea sp. USM4]QBJ78208.1 DUF3368 domain-containing protein [Aquitalea sp. USM4]